MIGDRTVNSWDYEEFPKDVRKRSKIFLTLRVHDNESEQRDKSINNASAYHKTGLVEKEDSSGRKLRTSSEMYPILSVFCPGKEPTKYVSMHFSKK